MTCVEREKERAAAAAMRELELPRTHTHEAATVACLRIAGKVPGDRLLLLLLVVVVVVLDRTSGTIRSWCSLCVLVRRDFTRSKRCCGAAASGSAEGDGPPGAAAATDDDAAGQHPMKRDAFAQKYCIRTNGGSKAAAAVGPTTSLEQRSCITRSCIATVVILVWLQLLYMYSKNNSRHN